MQFRADQYYQAAVERHRQAQRVYDQKGAYALTIYVSGLAVECLLRAFRWLHDTSFEGRHDLIELFKGSRLLAIDVEFMREEAATEEESDDSQRILRRSIDAVAGVWHNNMRFASEASLRAYLRARGLLKGIKGDALKKNAADVLQAADVLMQKGMKLWTWKRRSGTS